MGQVAFQQGFFTIARPCNRCGGNGRRITKPCETCEGAGNVRSENTLQLKIPAGVDDGTRMRMSGLGEAGSAGGPPGDLYVVLHVKEHPVFQRHGQDIVVEMPITFTQAALGSEVQVPTIDGEQSINVAAGTQSGTQVRLRGKGVPAVNGGQRGDQHVILVVRTPRKLSADARKLLEQLREMEGDEADEPGLFDRVKNIFGS